MKHFLIEVEDDQTYGGFAKNEIVATVKLSYFYDFRDKTDWRKKLKAAHQIMTTLKQLHPSTYKIKLYDVAEPEKEELKTE